MKTKVLTQPGVLPGYGESVSESHLIIITRQKPLELERWNFTAISSIMWIRGTPERRKCGSFSSLIYKKSHNINLARLRNPISIDQKQEDHL